MKPLALIAAGLLAFALAACGDDDSSTTTAPDTATTSEIPDSGGVGPNSLLRQGTAPEGVNFATSPAGVTLDLNDNASEALTSELQGAEVAVDCSFEDGSEATVGSGEWPADAGNATLVPDFAALESVATDSCTLSAGGSEVATATMDPVGP